MELGNSRCSQLAVEKQPSDDADKKVGQNLTPDHVDIGRSQWTVITPRLFDSLPYRQESEPEREAGSNSSDLEILEGSRHDAIGVRPMLGTVK